MNTFSSEINNQLNNTKLFKNNEAINNSNATSKLIFSPKNNSDIKPIVFKSINDKIVISYSNPENNKNKSFNKIETTALDIDSNNRKNPETIKNKMNNIYLNMQISRKNLNSFSSSLPFKAKNYFDNRASENEGHNGKDLRNNLTFKINNFYKNKKDDFERNKKFHNTKSLNTRNLFNNMLKLGSVKRGSHHSIINNKEINNSSIVEKSIDFAGDKILSRSINEIAHGNNNSILSTIYNKNDISENNSFNYNSYNETNSNDNSTISKNNILKTINIKYNLNTPKTVKNTNNDILNNPEYLNSNLNHINHNPNNSVIDNINDLKDNNPIMDISANDQSFSNIQTINLNNTNNSQISIPNDIINVSTNTIINHNNTPINSDEKIKENFGNYIDITNNESEKNMENEHNKYNTKLNSEKNDNIKTEFKSIKNEANSQTKNDKKFNLDSLDKTNYIRSTQNIFFPDNVKNEINFQTNSPNEKRSKTDLRILKTDLNMNIEEKLHENKNSLNNNSNKEIKNNSFNNDQISKRTNTDNSPKNIASAFNKVLKSNKKGSKLKDFLNVLNRQPTLKDRDEKKEILKENLIKKFSNKFNLDKHQENIFNEYMNNLENNASINFLISNKDDKKYLKEDINEEKLINLLSEEVINLGITENKQNLMLFIKYIIKNNDLLQSNSQKINHLNKENIGSECFDINKKSEAGGKKKPDYLSNFGKDNHNEKKLNKRVYDIFKYYIKVLNSINNLKVKEFDLKFLYEKDNFYRKSIKVNYDIKNKIKYICLKFYKDYILLSKEKREDLLDKKYSILRKEKKKYFKISIKIRLRNQNENTNKKNNNNENNENINKQNDKVEKIRKESEEVSFSFNNQLTQLNKDSRFKENDNYKLKLSQEEIDEIEDIDIYMKNLLKNINNNKINEKELPILKYLYKFDLYIELLEIIYNKPNSNNNQINSSNGTPTNFNSSFNNRTTLSYYNTNNNKLRNEKINKNFLFNPISDRVLNFEDFINLSNKLDVFQTLPYNANLNYINSLDDFLQEFFIHHFYFNFDRVKNIYSLILFPYRIGVSEGKSFEFPFFGEKCTFDILINKVKNTKREKNFSNNLISNSLIPYPYQNVLNKLNYFTSGSNIAINNSNLNNENSPVNLLINKNNSNLYFNQNTTNLNSKLVNHSPKDQLSSGNINFENSSSNIDNMSFFQNYPNDFGNNPIKYKSNFICIVIKQFYPEKNYIRIDVEIDDDSFVKLFSDLNNNIKDFFNISECLVNEKNEIIVDSYFYKDKSVINEKGTIANILLRTQEILKFLIKENLKKDVFRHMSKSNVEDKKNEELNKKNTIDISSLKEKDKEIRFREFVRQSENSLLKIKISNNLRNIDFWRIFKHNEEMKWIVDYSTIEKIHSKKINKFLKKHIL